MSAYRHPPNDSPFHPDNGDGYRRWRDQKLARAVTSPSELLVEFSNPSALSPAEHQRLAGLICSSNMAIYHSAINGDGSPEIALQLAKQFGLHRLDANWLADPDGVSSLRQTETKAREGYIPYTDRAIQWHTDGYYNAPERQIQAMLLHCVEPAAEGGENQLIDHEMLYLLLRDRDPGLVRALMRDDALTIPPRMSKGRVERPERTGPVFWLNLKGDLQMRYTIRKRNVIWADAPDVRTAVESVNSILAGDSEHLFTLRLEAGMGLICNNVLHNRSAFSDSAGKKRHLFRARYFDRIRC